MIDDINIDPETCEDIINAGTSNEDGVYCPYLISVICFIENI